MLYVLVPFTCDGAFLIIEKRLIQKTRKEEAESNMAIHDHLIDSIASFQESVTSLKHYELSYLEIPVSG